MQTESLLAYRFVPRGPFRFGERGVGLEETAEFPRSDTLFSAIVSAWRLLGGTETVKRWLAAFPTPDRPDLQPPVLLSSAFPYVGSVYFLPRPAIHLKSDEDDPKGAKHIEYLSWRRMEELLATADPPHARTEHLRQGRTVWIHPQDQAENSLLKTGQDTLWISGEEAMIPRVTVDRLMSASALYFQGQVRFADECGFYCLTRFCGDQANEFQKAVEQALTILGEEGLGARRSAGLGRFELQGPEVLTLRCPSDSNAHLLLSLYHPTKSEVTGGVLKDARYHLILRKGWISSPDDASQRRMGIRMLREGGILPTATTGNLTDVRPSGFPHAVYRSGLAFTVPCWRWVNA